MDLLGLLMHIRCLTKCPAEESFKVYFGFSERKIAIIFTWHVKTLSYGSNLKRKLG